MNRVAALLLAVLLAGCGSDSGNEQPGAQSGSAAKGGPRQGANSQQADQGPVTPNEDRVATIGVLNKRNNLTQDLVLRTGESRRAGNVIVKLESCEKSAPWERPREMGAFVQVFVEERPSPQQDPEWRAIFSGWLFKNAPSLNVVEHPVYDVWVKDCAMNFPGDEAKPAASASAQSAEKASGNASGASSTE